MGPRGDIVSAENPRRAARSVFSGVVVAPSPALPITRSAINTFNEGG